MITDHVREILLELGEDPKRQGLLDTPHRVEKALGELTAGYGVDIDKLINGALFDIDYADMVIVKNITFYSLCEHHMLPFFGRATVAYIPNKKVIGLSKIPKLVNVFARRLQIQERMTQQIAETLLDKLKPKGVGVIVNARHLCMEMRGAQSEHSPTTTSVMLGIFRDDARTRDEFLTLAKH